MKNKTLGLKHYIVSELDGKEIKKGKFKKFQISKYWWMQLRNFKGHPTMDYIIASNLADLKNKIIKADKNSLVIFDEGDEKEWGRKTKN